MDKVSGLIGFGGVLVHVRVTGAAQEDEIGESKSNLLISGAADAFDLPMMNVCGFPRTSYAILVSGGNHFADLSPPRGAFQDWRVYPHLHTRERRPLSLSSLF